MSTVRNGNFLTVLGVVLLLIFLYWLWSVVKTKRQPGCLEITLGCQQDKQQMYLTHDREIKIGNDTSYTAITNFSSDFVFHNGFDSYSGKCNETGLVSIAELKHECLAMTGCIGFSSDGCLKTQLLPFENWTVAESSGLYTLDIDYCQSTASTCQSGEECWSDKGKYSCFQQKDVVHVAVCINEEAIIGFMALLHSIIQHSNQRTVIHVITTDSEVKHLVEKKISCVPMHQNVKVFVLEYKLPKKMKELVFIQGHDAKYLQSGANFVRLYLAEILTYLSYVIFMDVDMVVRQDLGELWNDVYGMKEMLAVVPEGPITHRQEYLRTKLLYKRRYHTSMNTSVAAFNAGMAGMNLRKWRKKSYTQEALYWLNLNKQRRLWRLGTQPLMNLLAHNDHKNLTRKWNVSHKNNAVEIPFNEIAIHHWNGPCKPWMNCTQNEDWLNVWKMYDKGLCSSHGDCHGIVQGTSICNCTTGYSGNYCENYEVS